LFLQPKKKRAFQTFGLNFGLPAPAETKWPGLGYVCRSFSHPFCVQSLPEFSHYDLILTGGGMAGLSLAWHLSQRPTLRRRRILVIDREPKEKNDRTWAFWEAGTGPFEPILHRQWQTAWFHGTHGFARKLDLGDYRYKLLRGIDFYRFVRETLAPCSTVSFLYSPIRAVETVGNRGVVTTDAGTFSAEWVFDSTFRLKAMESFSANFSPIGNSPAPVTGPPTALLQHFKGWVVKTPTPAFDPATPTMMDFRIAQHGECRFVYVLPFSAHEALVEFTLFTPILLHPDAYDAELRTYLKNFLRIADFQVLEEEFGIIPMSAEPTTERPSGRVIRIGTAGGATRPSTGYTFARTQRRLQTIARNLDADFTRHPLDGEKAVIPARYRFFDEVFLNVFLHHRYPPAEVFTRLYARNRPTDVFRFLDEETTLPDDLRVIWAAPKGPFVQAATDVLLRKILR
jgi:lycopene beta-cyclase